MSLFAGYPLWNLLGSVFLVVMIVYLLYYFATARGNSKRGLRSEFLKNTRVGLQNFFEYYFVNAFRFLNSLWNPAEDVANRTGVPAIDLLDVQGRLKVTCPYASRSQSDVWIGFCDRCQNDCRLAGLTREIICQDLMSE